MPVFLKHSKRSSFQYIVEKFNEKLQGWKAKLLSFADRTTLIKAVAAALPTYAMTVTRFPENLCEELDKKISTYWCGENDEKRTCRLKLWEFTCCLQITGGLRIRSIWKTQILLFFLNLDGR